MTLHHTLVAFGVPFLVAAVLIIWHSMPPKRKPGKVIRLDEHENKIS